MNENIVNIELSTVSYVLNNKVTTNKYYFLKYKITIYSGLLGGTNN